MFLILAILFTLLWVSGFFLLHIGGLLIHLLLVFAVLSLVMQLVSRQRN